MGLEFSQKRSTITKRGRHIRNLHIFFTENAYLVLLKNFPRLCFFSTFLTYFLEYRIIKFIKNVFFRILKSFFGKIFICNKKGTSDFKNIKNLLQGYNIFYFQLLFNLLLFWGKHDHFFLTIFRQFVKIYKLWISCSLK